MMISITIPSIALLLSALQYKGGTLYSQNLSCNLTILLTVVMLGVLGMSVVMLSIVMLSVVMLSIVMLSVVTLGVVMLSVVMLSVVMLSVVIPSVAMLSVKILSVIILSIIMLKILLLSFKMQYKCAGFQSARYCYAGVLILSVVKLRVSMQTVVAPKKSPIFDHKTPYL